MRNLQLVAAKARADEAALRTWVDVHFVAYKAAEAAAAKTGWAEPQWTAFKAASATLGRSTKDWQAALNKLTMADYAASKEAKQTA